MNRVFFSRIVVAGMLLVASLPAGLAQNASTPPDNTKVNKRDRNKAEPTADSQKMNVQDRDMARNVRRALTSDKSLSTYAHNVKVISRNGMITLKGPVRTEEEKAAIEQKAKEVAGADKVTSEITVAPKK